MKPTRECEQPEIMLRALLVLDGLASLQDDLMCREPKTPVEHFVHDVYMIAHAAHGKCCTGGTDNWLDVIDERAKLLKEAIRMDLEKVLTGHGGVADPWQQIRNSVPENPLAAP